MNKVVLIQAPPKYEEVVPIFCTECLKHGIFDKIYVAAVNDLVLPDQCELIKLPEDRQFASNILFALDRVKEEILLLCCEDHIMLDRHNTKSFVKTFKMIQNDESIGQLRLTWNYKVSFGSVDKKNGVGDLSSKYEYLVSLQPSWWRRSYLLKILKPGEDAWETEILGSKRARKLPDRKVCVLNTIFFATNFYKSGKYLRHHFVDYADKVGYTIKKPMDVFMKRNTDGQVIKKIVPFVGETHEGEN